MKRSPIALAIAVSLLCASSFAQTTSTTPRRSTTAMPQIPPNTRIQVRINETISSAEAKAGDRWTGTLTEPVVVNGRTVWARGALAEGQVREAKPSGRLSSSGELSLHLTEVIHNGVRTRVYVQPAELKGESHQKGNIYKIGGGTALGAIIGGIAGGAKGAAIGAGVGAAAGTGAAAATGRQEAIVEAEAILEFTTVAPSESSRTGELSRRDGSTTGSTDTYGSTSSSTATSGSQATTSSTSADFGGGAEAGFSAQDRQTIRDCFRENATTIPASWTRRSALPVGSERALVKGGMLPESLENRVQYVPRVCEHRLPRIGNDFERVVYGGKVMLLDLNNRIVDVFDIYGQQ